MKKLLLIFLLLSTKANAITIGAGLNHPKPKQKVASQEYKTSLTIGESWNYKNINFAINTNRLFVRSNEFKLENGLRVKQETTYDALQIGYRIKRIIPAVFLANVKIEKKFLNQKITNHLLVYGWSMNYLITKDLSFGFGGTAKNEEGQSFFTNFTYKL